jgi:hypothetical protein
VTGPEREQGTAVKLHPVLTPKNQMKTIYIYLERENPLKFTKKQVLFKKLGFETLVFSEVTFFLSFFSKNIPFGRQLFEYAIAIIS